MVTHPKIYRPPSSIAKALAAIEAWQAGGNVQLIAESPGYHDKLRVLATKAKLKTRNPLMAN